jgi:hypothetical protein
MYLFMLVPFIVPLAIFISGFLIKHFDPLICTVAAFSTFVTGLIGLVILASGLNHDPPQLRFFLFSLTFTVAGAIPVLVCVGLVKAIARIRRP